MYLKGSYFNAQYSVCQMKSNSPCIFGLKIKIHKYINTLNTIVYLKSSSTSLTSLFKEKSKSWCSYLSSLSSVFLHKKENLALSIVLIKPKVIDLDLRNLVFASSQTYLFTAMVNYSVFAFILCYESAICHQRSHFAFIPITLDIIIILHNLNRDVFVMICTSLLFCCLVKL